MDLSLTVRRSDAAFDSRWGNADVVLMFVEFIDEAHFIKPFNRQPQFGPDVVFLPRAWVALTAQPRRLLEIRGTERLSWVVDQVAANGVQHALTLVIDQHSRVVLEDGHHRLLAAELHDIAVLPVRFGRSEQVRVECGFLPDILPSLLQQLMPS